MQPLHHIKSQIDTINEEINIIKKNKINCDLEKINSYLYTNNDCEIEKLKDLEMFLNENKIKTYDKKIIVTIIKLDASFELIFSKLE